MWILEIHTQVLTLLCQVLTFHAVFQAPQMSLIYLAQNELYSYVFIFKFYVEVHIKLFLVVFYFTVSNLSLNLFTKLLNVMHFFKAMVYLFIIFLWFLACLNTFHHSPIIYLTSLKTEVVPPRLPQAWPNCGSCLRWLPYSFGSMLVFKLLRVTYAISKMDCFWKSTNAF